MGTRGDRPLCYSIIDTSHLNIPNLFIKIDALYKYLKKNKKKNSLTRKVKDSEKKKSWICLSVQIHPSLEEICLVSFVKSCWESNQQMDTGKVVMIIFQAQKSFKVVQK